MFPMTAGTLWIEMTIAGSVWVACLFFQIMAWWLWWYPGESLAKLITPYLTYIAVAVVALSYIFGFIAHRVIQIFNWRLLERWKWQKRLRDRIDDFVVLDQDDKDKRGPKVLKERMVGETDIWDLDPHRLHREIDFQFAQVALLRSLAWSTLFLAVSILWWHLRIGHYAAARVYVLAPLWVVCFWVLLFLASRRQSRQYDMIREAALDVAQKHAGKVAPSPSQPSEPASTAPLIATVTISGASGTGANFEVKFNCPVTVLPPKKE
jgi:hypothetical protein